MSILSGSKTLIFVLFLGLSTNATAQTKAAIRQIKVTTAHQSSTTTLAHCASLKMHDIEGVVVILHGRGGHASTSDLAQIFLKFACRRRFAVAVPSAPTSNRNWPFEKIEGEKQDLFLLHLIKNTLTKEIGSKRVLNIYLVGISAGATFLMGDFYPRHGSQLKGFAAALCGGSQPTSAQITGMKELEKKFPLFVQISRKDFLFQQTEQGLKRYADMGLPLRARMTEEAGHCAFDFTESLERIEKQLN